MYGTIILILDYLATDVVLKLFTKAEEQVSFIKELDENGTQIKSSKNTDFMERMLNNSDDNDVSNTLLYGFNMGETILWQACLVTSLLFTIQILLFVKRYQKHVLNAYKGVYIDIPSPVKFKNSKLVSGSMRYRYKILTLF
jgi:hypothetical protein